MMTKTTLAVFAIVAAFAVAGLLIPGGLQEAEAKKKSNSNGGGDTEIEVRDFLNENNNECKDFADCVHQGSGDDEIDDINF